MTADERRSVVEFAVAVPAPSASRKTLEYHYLGPAVAVAFSGPDRYIP
jgi:hypothetical protein